MSAHTGHRQASHVRPRSQRRHLRYIAKDDRAFLGVRLHRLSSLPFQTTRLSCPHLRPRYAKKSRLTEQFFSDLSRPSAKQICQQSFSDQPKIRSSQTPESDQVLASPQDSHAELRPHSFYFLQHSCNSRSERCCHFCDPSQLTHASISRAI